MKVETFLGPETARAKGKLFGPKKVEIFLHYVKVMRNNLMRYGIQRRIILCILGYKME